MQSWLETQIANGFPGLHGSSISGSLAIQDELLNQVLQDALRRPTAPADARPTPAGPDIGGLLKLITRASVRTSPGALIVEFEVRV